MIGDIVFIRGRPEKVVSEHVVTVYCFETPEQMKLRMKEHRPQATFQYTSVKTMAVIHASKKRRI